MVKDHQSNNHGTTSSESDVEASNNLLTTHQQQQEQQQQQDETHPLLQQQQQQQQPTSATTTNTGRNAPSNSNSNKHRRIRSEFQSLYRDYQSNRRRRHHQQQQQPQQHQQHHRRHTSLGHFLVESIGSGLGVLAEDVTEAAFEVKDSFQQELRQSWQGERYFFDMTMTRSLSILPEALPELVHTTLKEEEEEEIVAAAAAAVAAAPEAAAAAALPIDRYLALLSAVLAVSSNGTALSLLHNVPSPLKLYWRMTATAALLFPLCLWNHKNNNNSNNISNGNDDDDDDDDGSTQHLVHQNQNENQTATTITTTVDDSTTSTKKDKATSTSTTATATMPLSTDIGDDDDDEEEESEEEYKNHNCFVSFLAPFLPQQELTHGQWLNFAAAVVSFAIHTLLFFTAFSLTSIGNAVIFANSQALLLILGKAVMGQAVVCLEGMGVVVAFTGAILCSLDTERADDDSGSGIDYPNPMLGDLAALGAAAFGVAYLTFAKAVRPHMSVTLFMFLVMLLGSLLVLLYMVVAGYTITFSNDPHTGLFGWLTADQGHVFIILYVAFVCNLFGTMGFVRAMEYFDNLIIAVATLLEPMIASIIATLFGVGVLPGLQGWAGNWLVIIGTLAVLYPSLSKGGGDMGH